MSSSILAARLSGAFLLVLALVAPATLTAAQAEPAAPPDSKASRTAPPLVNHPVTTLVVDTKDAAPILDRDNYVEGTVTLDGQTHQMEIKGRGNSTWQWPKKPYKIKIEDKAALLGDVPQKDWVLLANYRDRSALRTATAFTIAAQTTLAWTPKFRFVELKLNGEARGLYLLTEQVEQKTGRVDLPDGSYLLEINERMKRDGEPGFFSERGTPVTFKDPDEVTREDRRIVRGRVEAFEDILYGKKFTDPERGYAKHIDVDSFIDWYLVEELFANQDSNFRSSVNISLTPDGKFAMGPVWDFDISAGTRWNADLSPHGWHTRLGKHWISRMLQDPAFATKVKQRWNELVPVIEASITGYEDAFEALRPAAEADFQMWHQDLTEWSAHGVNFWGEVAFLRRWINSRIQWMSRNESMWGAVNMVTKERDRTVWVPVRLLAPSEKPVDVSFELDPSSTATQGEDFTMNPGRLTFEPGTVVRYFPIRIKPDDATEMFEHINIKLKASDNETIVGSPDLVTVTIAASDQTVDAAIRRRGQKAYLGEGIVDRGARQMLGARAFRGGRRTFELKVTNTGNANNRVRLTAMRKGPITVRWFMGRREITRGINRGIAPRIKAGQSARLRAVVRVRKNARFRTRTRIALRSQWFGDTPAIDRVGVQLIVRAPKGQ